MEPISYCWLNARDVEVKLGNYIIIRSWWHIRTHWLVIQIANIGSVFAQCAHTHVQSIRTNQVCSSYSYVCILWCFGLYIIFCVVQSERAVSGSVKVFRVQSHIEKIFIERMTILNMEWISFRPFSHSHKDTQRRRQLFEERDLQDLMTQSHSSIEKHT